MDNQHNKVERTASHHLFFKEEYDTQIVIKNFGKLRNIILNTQDLLIAYMVTQELSITI